MAVRPDHVAHEDPSVAEPKETAFHQGRVALETARGALRISVRILPIFPNTGNTEWLPILCDGVRLLRFLALDGLPFEKAINGHAQCLRRCLTASRSQVAQRSDYARISSHPTVLPRFISRLTAVRHRAHQPPLPVVPVVGSLRSPTRRSCSLVRHQAIAAGPPWLCQSH